MEITTKKSPSPYSKRGSADSYWEVRSSGETESSWFSNLRHPLRFNRLAQNISVDIAIIGAGI
jgi:hypothetical protein